LSEPFCKKVPTPPKTFKKVYNQKLLEVQKPFHEKGSGRRRQIMWWILEWKAGKPVDKCFTKLYNPCLMKSRSNNTMNTFSIARQIDETIEL